MPHGAYLRPGNSRCSCSLGSAAERPIGAERTWSPRPGHLPIWIKSDPSLDLKIEYIPPASGPCRSPRLSRGYPAKCPARDSREVQYFCGFGAGVPATVPAGVPVSCGRVQCVSRACLPPRRKAGQQDCTGRAQEKSSAARPRSRRLRTRSRGR